jgi:hypothetical protein
MDDCVVSVVEPGISVSVVMGTKVASVAAEVFKDVFGSAAADVLSLDS